MLYSNEKSQLVTLTKEEATLSNVLLSYGCKRATTRLELYILGLSLLCV
jgi:hypothetical protein